VRIGRDILGMGVGVFDTIWGDVGGSCGLVRFVELAGLLDFILYF